MNAIILWAPLSYALGNEKQALLLSAPSVSGAAVSQNVFPILVGERQQFRGLIHEQVDSKSSKTFHYRQRACLLSQAARHDADHHGPFIRGRIKLSARIETRTAGGESAYPMHHAVMIESFRARAFHVPNVGSY